jgi:peptidoglycan/LPS O-acetylase OafA/YrhL
MMTPAAAEPAKKVYTLNALRGYSAVFVIFYHMVENGQYLDPGYWPGWFKYFYDRGHLRVLIFFVISGAVIYLSTKAALTWKTVPGYLKKRMLRIYPLYAISIIAALIVSKVSYSPMTIVGNFTFLQVLFFDVILTNGPIFTLHYEILFYLLFIGVSIYNINPVKIIIFSIILGFANYFIYPAFGAPIITAYCFSFSFWILGLVIAKYFKVDKAVPVNNTKLVSFLFLITAIPYLNEINTFLYQYSIKWFGHQFTFPYDGHINHWFQRIFNIYDFAYLPYCFLAVIVFSNRTFKYKKLIFWIFQLVPAFTLLMIFKRTGHIEIKKMIFPVSCYFMSMVLLATNFKMLDYISGKIISFFIWMGGVSYGMYIIHGPILAAFSRIHFFSGSHATFLVRMILYFIVTFIAAYLLEKKFHVWVVSKLGDKKVVPQMAEPKAA